MNMKASSRIIADRIVKRPVQSIGTVWDVASRSFRMFNSPNLSFTRHVMKDHIRFLFNTVDPIQGQTKERARAAVDWILRAQDVTGNGGVSYGYFPCDGKNGWRSSYPETTGYLITSLLEFARRYRDVKVRQRALQMALWEVDVQMESGAVQAGILGGSGTTSPAAFNTGMVLDGWSEAYRHTDDKVFYTAGRRAADFLVSDLDQDGYFRSQGRVRPDGIKTFNCLCAWSLYRFGEDVEDRTYRQVAIRIVEAALKQQQPNGWFANNCLTRPEAPLLHTIGYTLQGILEVGILAKRDDFVEAVRCGTDPLLSRISSKGFLHGRFYSDWEPAVFSSCLTGSAQLAVVCFRLFEHTGAQQYLTAANCLVNFLKGLQEVHSHFGTINGALAGSFPFFGQYITAGYPNWATKYFLDSLLLQDQFEQKEPIAQMINS